MLNQILQNAPVYLLVFVRCMTMIVTLPLLSMRSASRVAKVALSGYIAFFVYSTVEFPAYNSMFSENSVADLQYILIMIGEALLGVLMGFYISIIFAAFSSAGQFMGFQMGLSAASSYDAMSQVENPLMGQFFNLVAMLVFLQTKWFQQLFLGGLTSSFKTLTAYNLVVTHEPIVKFLISALTKLFSDALVIALPVMGTLFLITVCTGLLTKAAPQMNLLSEGFPIMILVAYFVIATVMPNLIDFFVRSFNGGFHVLQNLFIQVSGGGIK